MKIKIYKLQIEVKWLRGRGRRVGTKKVRIYTGKGRTSKKHYKYIVQ